MKQGSWRIKTSLRKAKEASLYVGMHVVSAQLNVGFGQEKTMKQAIPWMPLSVSLFQLKSSILTWAKRAANQNNVATEERS